MGLLPAGHPERWTGYFTNISKFFADGVYTGKSFMYSSRPALSEALQIGSRNGVPDRKKFKKVLATEMNLLLNFRFFAAPNSSYRYTRRVE